MAPLLVGASNPQTPPAASPSAAPAQATVFRAEANYVEVEAFVTDEGGQVVSGLSRDDFQVFEEGAREEIAVFAEVRIPIDRAEATTPGRARSTQDVATNEEGIRGRVFAIVLDELHTDARLPAELCASGRLLGRVARAQGHGEAPPRGGERARRLRGVCDSRRRYALTSSRPSHSSRPELRKARG
jgi:hypothetical protein